MNEHRIVAKILEEMEKAILKVFRKEGTDGVFYRYRIEIEEMDDTLEYVLQKWVWDNHERKIKDVTDTEKTDT